MDRYNIFRALMDFVADNYDVTEATMCNYVKEIEIKGVSGENEIQICVNIREVKKDA